MRYVFRSSILAIALLFSCALPAAAGGPQTGSGPLKLSLKPDRPVYPLKDAVNGNVTITARLTNAGDDTVFVAHPNACVPDRLGEGETFDTRGREGRSEMLVYIQGPDGTETVLRNNMLRGFDPGNRFHLFIEPGGSEDIRLGFFSPFFALGQWDIEEPVFTMRGTYKVRMLCRNHFTKAVSFKPAPDIFMDEAPWTGEVESDSIFVVVE